MKSILTTTTAAALLAAGTASAAVVSFNTAGDLANNFYGANSSGTVANNYAEANGVGIGNPASRGLNTIGIDGNYSTLIFNQESFSLANMGDSVTVSAFALRRDDTNPGDNSSSFLRLGLTDGNASANNRLTGGNGNGIALDIYRNAGTPATDVIFRSYNKVGSGTLATLAGGATTLTSGNWYKLTATFTNAGSNNISISGLLENFGTDGTTLVGTTRTIAPFTLANAGLAADSTVYGAFVARQDGGSDSVDNFSVAVPEPGSALLAFCGGAGALLVRRRN